MDNQQPPTNPPSKQSTTDPLDGLRGSDVVGIYTSLRILMKMKVTLGLEAMLECSKEYLKTIEKSYPGIELAVTEALSFMNIEKMYLEAKESNESK